jgi:hypothetical protein
MKIRKTKIKKETIKVPIFWTISEGDEIQIDEESMRDEFEDKLREVIKNPNKFVDKK